MTPTLSYARYFLKLGLHYTATDYPSHATVSHFRLLTNDFILFQAMGQNNSYAKNWFSIYTYPKKKISIC